MRQWKAMCARKKWKKKRNDSEYVIKLRGEKKFGQKLFKRILNVRCQMCNSGWFLSTCFPFFSSSSLSCSSIFKLSFVRSTSTYWKISMNLSNSNLFLCISNCNILRHIKWMKSEKKFEIQLLFVERIAQTTKRYKYLCLFNVHVMQFLFANRVFG